MLKILSSIILRKLLENIVAGYCEKGTTAMTKEKEQTNTKEIKNYDSKTKKSNRWYE